MAGWAGSAGGPVGLVLAGGGARGAYELGALAALLPALEARGERPQVIVGTSVGAINAMFLAATADRPVEEVVERGAEIWEQPEIRGRARAPRLAERAAAAHALRRAVPRRAGARLDALLDPAPLRATLAPDRPVRGDRAQRRTGALHAAAVVSTSALTSRSVVFHRGGGAPRRDDKRGIDYVDVGASGLTEEHVRASSAIPGAFPAVHVETPERARGWYVDGGTRLNTPIKPALALGAERVIVIALNAIGAPAASGQPEPIAGERRAGRARGRRAAAAGGARRPARQRRRDARDDQRARRQRTAADAEADKRKRQVPYIFVAPARARRDRAARAAGLRAALRATSATRSAPATSPSSAAPSPADPTPRTASCSATCSSRPSSPAS